MALPASVPVGTVTGTWYTPSGGLAVGTIVFLLMESVEVPDDPDGVVLPVKTVVDITAGVLNQTLPSGIYAVSIRLAELYRESKIVEVTTGVALNLPDAVGMVTPSDPLYTPVRTVDGYGPDASGNIDLPGGGGGGAVDSVFGRTGVVTAQSGDYTKAQVGLGSVDNTSDLAKPISTLTQTALDGKSNTGHTHVIANVTGLQAALDAKETSGAAATAVAAHVAAPDPHTQYALDSDLSSGLATKENVGVAASVLAAHVAAADPHTQYLKESDAAPVATAGTYASLTGKPTIPVASDAFPSGVGQFNSAGTSPDFSRADHSHNGIPQTMLTAKGSLVVASASNTAIEVTVGANGNVLLADSTKTSGVAWGRDIGNYVEPYFRDEYNMFMMTGKPLDFLNASTWNNNDHSVQLLFVPAGKAITKVGVAVRTNGVYSATGTPSQVKVYDDTGALIGSSPDDVAMWLTKGWNLQTLSTPITASGSDRWVYVGISGGGFTGHSAAWPSAINPDLPEYTSTGLIVGRRRCFYSGSALGLPNSINPATYGTTTTYIPLIALI